ncbi:peptidase M23B [Salinisphaera sp. PC39]|uniref:OapA family protein n=1 Tax=Salinisphaera sp. PC39 TaxID=1304156 RepID=UPI003340BBDF
MSRIGNDYIWLQDKPSPRGGWRWVGLGLAVPLVVGAVSLTGPGGTGVEAERRAALLTESILLPDSPANAPLADAGAPNAQTVASLSERFSGAAASTDGTNSPARDWTEVDIQRGDTLSLAFQRHGLSYKDSLAIAHLDEHGTRFTRGLRAGDTLLVDADDSGHVLALDYPLDAIRTLEVRASEKGEGYTAEIVAADVEHRTAYASGRIDTSFYVDALEAGLSDKLIMDLAYIFGWDIDFVLDIRAGDRFVVVYDELYRDGEKIGDGKILAAEFVNRGRELRALRYTDAEGQGDYYAPDGKAMKKAFIRTPLDQFRISSHFNLRRKHPVLNRIRAHEGTDYAAPSGTPIKATGNGRIVFRGRRGGYGNVIEIKHSSRYTTRYAHMSRFASGLGVGSRVQQGQVIGYVGMSGLATGPHLHYEFRVHGHPRNPETVDLPEAEPLPEKHMADFREQAQPLLAQLDALGRTQLAAQDSDAENVE